jgi:hypothetical protein
LIVKSFVQVSGTVRARGAATSIMIDRGVDANWPDAGLYPVLDKVCAMYERHDPAASNRYRDLANRAAVTPVGFASC